MSLDIATLGIAVDSRQVKAGASDLDNLAASGKKAEEQTNRLGNATSVLSRLYKDLAAAAATWKVYDLIRDSAMLAARYETMGVVMRVAGNNAGYTGAKMLELEKQLTQTGISMLQARNSLTQLATANIDLANATGLARTAQDLAVVANINSSEALGRMIHGIKSGESEVLRTLGLNVSFEASYKKLALSLGTTVEKLSEHQKMVARTNAVLSEGARYQGIYEEAMGTAGKAMTSLTRYWEDFKVKAGEAFLPALSEGVRDLTDALKAANAELDKAGSDGTVSGIGARLGGAFRTVYETVAVLAANVAFVFQGLYRDVEFVFQGIGRDIGAIAAMIAAMGTGNFSGAKEIFKSWGEDTKAARVQFEKDSQAAVDALAKFEQKILAGATAQAAASKMTEQERIAAGEAARKAQEAEEKRLKASEEARKAAKKEAEAYQTLRKSLEEKIAVARLDGAEQEKLTEGQKLAAKFVVDIASGTLKLTDAHKARVSALLEELIAQEKVNDAMRGQAEAQKYIDELNSKFSRDNRDKRAGFEVETESAQRLRQEMNKVEDQARSVHENIIRMWGDGKLSPEAYRQAFENLNAAIATQKEEVRQLNEEQDRLNGSWEYGAKRAMTGFMDSAKNVASMTERLFSNAFQNMEDALVQFSLTGKLNFSNFANSLIADLIRIQVRMAMTSAMQAAGGSEGIFGMIARLGAAMFMGGAGSEVAAEATPVYQDASTVVAHSGGLVGSTSFAQRTANMGLFAGARRYHTGGDILGPDEVPIIAQKGERVLSRREVAAGDKPVAVDVVVNNYASDKASAQVQARQNNGRLELEVTVSEVIAKDVAKNGPITQNLGNAFGLTRRA